MIILFNAQQKPLQIGGILMVVIKVFGFSQEIKKLIPN